MLVINDDDARADLVPDATRVLDAAIAALGDIDDHLADDRRHCLECREPEATLRRVRWMSWASRRESPSGRCTAVAVPKISPPLFESMEILGKTRPGAPVRPWCHPLTDCRMPWLTRRGRADRRGALRPRRHAHRHGGGDPAGAAAAAVVCRTPTCNGSRLRRCGSSRIPAGSSGPTPAAN